MSRTVRQPPHIGLIDELKGIGLELCGEWDCRFRAFSLIRGNSREWARLHWFRNLLICVVVTPTLPPLSNVAWTSLPRIGLRNRLYYSAPDRPSVLPLVQWQVVGALTPGGRQLGFIT